MTSRRSWRSALAALAGATATAALISVAAPAFAEEVTLHMAVPDWPPTRIMKDMFDKTYKAPSGNTVKLDVDFIPWPDYYTRLNASLTSGEKKYNMAVSDSQWLGAFIEGGYYLKINKFVDADPGLQQVFKELHPAVKAAYSTYPYKSDNLYGFPQMPDVIISYYRKDVFCDAGEQKAFQTKYNEKLPCTPEEMDNISWDTFGKIGEFFQRKKGDLLAGKPLDDDFYGIEYQSGKGYDFSTSQVDVFLWQHGANIWDETQAPKGHAEGQVNSPEAVKAFDHYLSFLKYFPPVVKTGGLDIFKTDELFREGKVAINLNWVGFAESSLNPSTSKVADKVAFAQQPGIKGPDGKLVRWSNIGGQPFVLMTWNTDVQNKEALDFVKWWLSKDIQHAFAAQGGQSAIKSVYTDPKYETYRPWNRAYVQSLDWQKDLWHIPEFFEMLVQQQEQYDAAITGKQDAKTTLDNIAAFQEKLLKEAGRVED
jgi:multiple sugar transport system substrate-binding protein